MLGPDMFATTSTLEKFLVGLSLCGLLGVAGCSGSKAQSPADKAAETETDKAKDSPAPDHKDAPEEAEEDAPSVPGGERASIGRGMSDKAVVSDDEKAMKTKAADEGDGAKTEVMMDE